MSKINRSIILVNPRETAKSGNSETQKDLGLLSDWVLMGFIRTASRSQFSSCLRGVCLRWGFKYDAGFFRLLVGLSLVGGLKVRDVLVREQGYVRKSIYQALDRGFVVRLGKGSGLNAYYIPTARGRLFVSECLQALRVEAEKDILNVMGWKGQEEQEKTPNKPKIEGGKRKRGFVGDWD